MANIKDIHGNLLSLSASDILIPSLGISLAEAIAQRLLPVPDNVTEQVEGLESKVAHAVGTISSVTVDVATDDTGTTHAEGAYQDGVLAITLYNVKGDKGDALTFDDLTDEQKAELKGEKMTFADLTEEDKNELRGAEGKGGKSAYDIAVENGFVGTETEWLISLRGPKGEPGISGKDGTNFEAGDNVTIVPLPNGKKQINASLPPGTTTDAGTVAYSDEAEYNAGTLGKKVHELFDATIIKNDREYLFEEFYDTIANKGEMYKIFRTGVGDTYNDAVESNADYYGLKIPIYKNDTVKINNFYCASTTGQLNRIVTTNSEQICNYVHIFPTAKLDYNIEFIVEEDGYLYLNGKNSKTTLNVVITNHKTVKDEIEEIQSGVGNDSIDGFFVMPHYIDCVIGMKNPIFLECLHSEPDGVTNGLISVDGKVKIGSTIYATDVYNELICISPSINTPELPLTLKRHYKNGSVAYQQDVILRPIDRSGATKTNWNIIVCGSSNIDGTMQPCELFELLGQDNDINVTSIGSYTVTDQISGNVYHHEGRGGWSWERYLDPTYENTESEDDNSGSGNVGKTNLFMHNGVLDFSYYMENVIGNQDGIDIFIVNLGSNDVTQGLQLANDNRIAEIINASKTFIDALLRDFPNCKIVVGLPTIGAPISPYSGKRQIIYKKSIQRLNKAYIDTYDNDDYPNVVVSPFTIFMNRKQLFKHEDVKVDDYVDNLVNTDGTLVTGMSNVIDEQSCFYRRYPDMLHCYPNGYRSWGRGLYRTVRAIINGLYN